MKSSKGKARSQRRDLDKTPPRSRRGWLFIAMASLAVVAIAVYLLRADPRRLMREGEALLDTDPVRAGQLLERSVSAAGNDFPEAQLLLCVALGKQARWIEALGCFSLIKDKSACDGRQLVELGNAASSAGEFILAEQSLEAALNTSFSEFDTLKALLPVRLARGHEEHALAECRRMAALAPDSADPHTAQARIFRRRREILGAIAEYRAALAKAKLPAQAATIRRELVEVLVQEGSTEEARREFDQLDPSNVNGDQLTLLRAYILRLERRSREAIDQLTQFMAAHPDHQDAKLLLGTLYLDLEQYELAANTLEQLTQIQPFHKEAHYLLGRAYLKLGQPEKAKTHLDRSQKLSAIAQEIATIEGRMAAQQVDAQSYLRLAELYDQTGRPELAAHLRQAAETNRRAVGR